MYVCVRVRVCVWGRRSWEKKEKWKWKEKRKRNEKNKETGEKREHKLIHTDKQRDGQTDRRTGRQAKIIHGEEIQYWTI